MSDLIQISDAIEAMRNLPSIESIPVSFIHKMIDEANADGDYVTAHELALMLVKWRQHESSKH